MRVRHIGVGERVRIVQGDRAGASGFRGYTGRVIAVRLALWLTHSVLIDGYGGVVGFSEDELWVISEEAESRPVVRVREVPHG